MIHAVNPPVNGGLMPFGLYMSRSFRKNGVLNLFKLIFGDEKWFSAITETNRDETLVLLNVCFVLDHRAELSIIEQPVQVILGTFCMLKNVPSRIAWSNHGNHSFLFTCSLCHQLLKSKTN